MPDVDLPFSRAEYAERLARVRASMDASGIDVLFATDPSNMAWLTGYDGWSFYVHQGVIIPPTGDPITWTRAMDARGAEQTVYMAAENITSYTDDYVMHDGFHAMTELARILRERGLDKLRLGVEMENYYYTAKAHAVLTSELGGPFIDATGLVNKCRSVKSQTELKYMRRAGIIVENMYDRILEIFEPGMRKNDVVAEILHTGVTGGHDADGTPFGGDYSAIAPLVPTGIEATAAHLTWSDKPVPNNSGTFFEIAGVHRRYHVPTCRTIWLGDPPKDVRHVEEVTLEATAAGMAKARVGNTAGDVATAFYDVLRKRGIHREGRCGYPIGLSYPPDWGERSFSIREGDTWEFKENETFHFMPAMWMEDWGLEITETLQITNGAPKPLANIDRKLFVKP